MNAHIYEQITDLIITLLVQGTVPWQKPWKARTGMPRNLVSQKPYRGINVFLLLATSYESPFWLTFRQPKRHVHSIMCLVRPGLVVAAGVNEPRIYGCQPSRPAV